MTRRREVAISAANVEIPLRTLLPHAPLPPLSLHHCPIPPPRASQSFRLNLLTDRVIGNGSFGVVFEARIVESGETVAIKKVLQDKRFKNRELAIMKQLKHPNIVALKHYFYQNGEKEEEVYLNLVLEFIPDTVYKITRQYTKMRQLPPLICVKVGTPAWGEWVISPAFGWAEHSDYSTASSSLSLSLTLSLSHILPLQLYMYQLCRSLAYLHSTGICHRDIKPQNLLVDSRNHVLKLCDFGSAKALLPGEPSVAYICSRYYRAPELIFGATEYTTAIDVWSSGCVAAELLLGHPLFPGDTGVDQLVEIIKVLGTPTKEEVMAMNPAYTEFKFPQIRPYPWAKIFRLRTPPAAIDFINSMLQYVPSKRVTALEACAHPFFDELRDPEVGARAAGEGRATTPVFHPSSADARRSFNERGGVLGVGVDWWFPPHLLCLPIPSPPSHSQTRLPETGMPLPVLFNFSTEELAGVSREMREKLIPPHARTASNWLPSPQSRMTAGPPTSGVIAGAAPSPAPSSPGGVSGGAHQPRPPASSRGASAAAAAAAAASVAASSPTAGGSGGGGTPSSHAVAGGSPGSHHAHVRALPHAASASFSSSASASSSSAGLGSNGGAGVGSGAPNGAGAAASSHSPPRAASSFLLGGPPPFLLSKGGPPPTALPPGMAMNGGGGGGLNGSAVTSAGSGGGGVGDGHAGTRQSSLRHVGGGGSGGAELGLSSPGHHATAAAQGAAKLAQQHK